MHLRHLAIPLLLLLLGGTLGAQQASFTTFGSACNFSGSPAPSIGATAPPVLGSSFTVTYQGPNAIEPGLNLTDHPTLLIGLSRVDLPVPQVLPIQPSSCTLYPLPELMLPMPPDPSGRRFIDRVTFTIPNDPSLLGATAYLQWMTPHSQCYFVGCGLGWVVFSEGARAVVGL